MKKILLMTAMLAAVLTLVSCGDVEKETENAIITEDASETTADMEAAAELSESAQTVSEEETADKWECFKGPDDYYIEVTPYDGEPLYVYYQYFDDEEGRSASVYMHEPSDEPDRLFGYMAMVQREAPAEECEMYSAAEMREFFDRAHFKYGVFDYRISEGASKGQLLDIEEEPEEYDKLVEIILGLDPEYIPGTEDIEIQYSYDRMQPITGISFERDFMTFTSRFIIRFFEYEGRLAANITIVDFNDLIAAAVSEEYTTPEQLEKAYYNSRSCTSPLFYIEDTALYDFALKYIIFSERNELPGVKQERVRKTEQQGFSEEFSELFAECDAEDYETVGMGQLRLLLPKSRTVGMEGDSGITCTYESDGESYSLMLVKTDSVIYSENSFNTKTGKTADVLITGKFYDRSCSYVEYMNGENAAAALYFCDDDYDSYRIVCTSDSKERTAGFTRFCKNVFGSLSLYREIPEVRTDNAPIMLSDTPSIYGDELYELAEGYSYYSDDMPAGGAGVVNASFYSIDIHNVYESGFECWLEKQQEDGKWYEVLPIAELRQENSGMGKFYNVLEDGRDFVTFDLAAYPPLPEGIYRIVKPYCEKGGDDPLQYAAFYDFYVTAECITDTGVTAECESSSYRKAPESISYTLSSENPFVIGEIVDIERCVDGVWGSVRTEPLTVNSIGGSYSLCFEGSYDLDTRGFDLSESGEYRLRISVGSIDSVSDNFFYADYGTVYAGFCIE